MKTRSEVVDCPACGRRRSAMVVASVSYMEADALSDKAVRSLGTVTCPTCGYWFYSPPKVSSDANKAAA